LFKKHFSKSKKELPPVALFDPEKLVFLNKRIPLPSGLKKIEKMKNPYKEKPWFKFLSNKYVWVLLFFVTWMLFLDNYSYFDHRFLDQQINELKENKTYYQDEIKKDQENIKELKNPEQVEKYAREKYYMKKDSEDIYIIEFEGDTLKK
jgi:cell division protein DivIC